MGKYKPTIGLEIHAELKTNSKIFIWLDSCFGACDIPLELKNLKIDLLIQFGHNQWPFWKSKTLEV